MATKEEQDTLRLLVQHVSRAFYEPKYTIIMDQLARHPVLKDDDLAGRMGLQAKELNKIIAVLAADNLVHVYRQNELKEGAQRSVGRQYYYIEYQHFCNVVKWRVAEMRRIIDSTLRNELDNKGYICPQCHKSYSPLEVDKLMDFSLGAFICEICHAELVDNENSETVRGSQDRMQRFNNQMWFIREGLRKSEAMVLPAFDVALWVKNNSSDVDKQKATESSGLKVAGSGPGSGKQDDGIEIMMSMDKDESTRKTEREAEAAAKRQQNLLPAWHMKSTISGHLTALGVREIVRVGASAAAGAAEPATRSSNDAILRGLGTVGPARMDRIIELVEEEVKPVVNQESDYYDQYYASLAASSAASSQVTPSGMGATWGDDFGDFEEEEEEDRKPSVQYLDSLNDYRKRSRSKEDEGAAGKKLVKLEEPYCPNGSILTDPLQAEALNGDDKTRREDPVVHVNGAPIALSKVTEEDQDLMTPEEYTAYFEAIQAQS